MLLLNSVEVFWRWWVLT